MPNFISCVPFGQSAHNQRQSNEASETSIPTTFVDDAEFIWRESEGGKTQAEIAEIMGWSRSKVLNYSQLAQICKKAWQLINDTTLRLSVSFEDQGDVSLNDTIVSFNEGLLRPILQLRPRQQFELVCELASAKITKGKFKTLAEAYKARNEAKRYGTKQLGSIGYSLCGLR